MRLKRLSIIALGIYALGLTVAYAQWPDRSLKIIVPFVAGGSSDTLARIFAEALRERLGQTVVVENRPGGNSSIGMSAVAQAPADGYTLIQGHMGTHAVTPAITPPSGYDPAKAFVTVTLPATSASILLVRANFDVKSLSDLVALAKSKPGTLNYGSPGIGSPSHMAVVQLASLTGIKVTHVAYRGNAAAITDMLNGTLDFMFASPAESLQFVKEGKFKALATTGATRSAATPEVPTVGEVINGYDFRMWHVLSVRADTPPEVVTKLQQAANDIVASAPFKKRLDDLGLDASPEKPSEADAFVKAEFAKWSKIVKDTGIKAE
ncbi:MAG: tripartite tricarboxylate transporter substrate binding protein [Pseudolabrys sp.]|nr:tripartite tricarboxylate transporter substrate binding protein [Pseudolabrys sp.]